MEKITEEIVNIGVNDRDITLFEGQYEVKKGYGIQLLCHIGRAGCRDGHR